jgi:hypothetical protein
MRTTPRFTHDHEHIVVDVSGSMAPLICQSDLIAVDVVILPNLEDGKFALPDRAACSL